MDVNAIEFTEIMHVDGRTVHQATLGHAIGFGLSRADAIIDMLRHNRDLEG